MPTVTFLEVKSTHDKLAAISKTVQHHYEREEAVLIVVPNEEAAQYVDQLLWKLPADGFLPHDIGSKECNDVVLITTQKQNLNHAPVLIQLCQEASAIAQEFQQVYELYDRTHPSKEKAAQERKEYYRAQGFALSE